MTTTTTLAAWFHDWSPFAWRFTESFGIRWYGLAYALGFVGGGAILHALGRRGLSRLAPERVVDDMTLLILGVVAGGRLGYVAFYRPSLLWSFSKDLPFWGVLRLHEGGMASHGGMVGLLVAAYLVARSIARAEGEPERPPDPKARPSAWLVGHVADLLALAAPVGLFFGRLANFINGELLGKVVAMPGRPAPWWTVRFPQELLGKHAPELSPAQESQLAALIETYRRAGDTPDAPLERLVSIVQGDTPGDRAGVIAALEPLVAARHPSQLYQALAEGVVLGLFLWMLWRRPRQPWFITGWFLIAYGVMRVATELWRLPDDFLAIQRPAGLSRGQWLSVAMVAIGALALSTLARRAGASVGGWGARRPVITAKGG